MNTEPITPRPPASLATSQQGNAPPPQPPRTAPAGGSHAHQRTLFSHTNRGQVGQLALLTDTQSYGGTVRSSPALLDAMNTTLGSSRQRHETHLQQRVANLKERDRKRTELVQGYHSHRQVEMVQQLDHLAKREDHAYEYLTEVHEAQHERTLELKYQEIERRREFSGRRGQRLSSREDAAEALREAVYTTPNQNRFPRKNSPKVMSREVVDRLLIMPVATSPRALGAAEGNSDPSSQPPVETSKEAITRLQAQRDAQVEHHRHQQEQSLSEKKMRREEHLHALKERLDGIVHNAQDDNRRRQRKRREEEERIAAWRWRKQHALRAEAIDRLTAHTAVTENDAQQTTASETGHQAAPQVEEKRDQYTVDKSSSPQQRKSSPQRTAARTSPRNASPRTGTTAAAAESSEGQPTESTSESTAQRSATKSSLATRHQQDMKAHESRSTAAPTAATETAPQQAKPQKPTVARSEPKNNQRRHQEDKVIESSGESQPREVSGDDKTTAQAGRAAVAIAKPQPPLRPKEDSAAVSRKPVVNKKETKAQGDQPQPHFESDTSKPTDSAGTTAVVESSSKGSSGPSKVADKSKKNDTIPAKSTSVAKAAEDTTVNGTAGSEETVTSTEVTVVEKKAAATDSKTNSSKNVKKASKDAASPPPKKSAASKTRNQTISASEGPPVASTATPPEKAVADDDGKVVVVAGDSRPAMMLPRPTSASSARDPTVHSDTVTPLKPRNAVVPTSVDQSSSSVVDPAAYAAAAISAAQGTAANRAASPTSSSPRASHIPPRPNSGSRSIPSPPPAVHNNAASTSASTPLKQSTHSLLDQSGSSVLDPAAYAAGAIAAAEHTVAGNSETDNAARSSSPGRPAPLPPRPNSGSRHNASKAPNSANETPLLKPYTPMEQSASIVDPAAFAAKAIAAAEGTHHQEAGASQQQPPLVPSRGNSATRRSPSPNATPILSAAGSPLQKAKTTTNNTSLNSATGGGLKSLDQSSSVVDPAASAAGAIAAAQQTANLPGVATPLHSQSGKMDQSSSVVDPAAFAAKAIAAAEVSNAEHHSRADEEDEVPVGMADMSM